MAGKMIRGDEKTGDRRQEMRKYYLFCILTADFLISDFDSNV